MISKFISLSASLFTGTNLITFTVFSAGEEEMGVRHELQANDVVLMSEDRTMTITKVQTPDFDISIGT